MHAEIRYAQPDGSTFLDQMEVNAAQNHFNPLGTPNSLQIYSPPYLLSCTNTKEFQIVVDSQEPSRIKITKPIKIINYFLKWVRAIHAMSFQLLRKSLRFQPSKFSTEDRKNRFHDNI